MSKKRFSVRAILAAVFITFLLTGGLGILAARHLMGPGRLAVLESLELIEDRFVGDYDEEAVIDRALAGLVDGLDDRWSAYLTPAQREVRARAMKNAYVGIGVTYQRVEEPLGMEIVAVVAGGPAEEAGLRVGQIITAIDGAPLTDAGFDEAVGRIGGLDGQDVVLTVEENGVSRDVTVSVRAVVNSPVTYELLEGGVGYIRLENFFENSAGCTIEAVEDLLEQGAEGLLFDVRGNPGGYVTELTALLDRLLPQGPIFAEHTKDGPVQVTQSDEVCVDVPMAVLVDGDSYSAAELFAAQLRESAAAPLIGQPTFGKGYYQQGFRLSNGGELHISTGMYTTGGGVSLIGVGLTPDRVVEGAQAQLDAALDILRDEMERR